MRALVVDSDRRMADDVRRALTVEGHAVDVVHTGTEAVWMGTEVGYAAIVLDVNIPAPNGIDVCRTLRANQRWSPILLLTTNSDVAQRIDGLDAGADDHLAKPFAMGELTARLRAITRRAARPRPSVLSAGSVSLDPSTRTVMSAGRKIELSPKEFGMLEIFMRNAGEVLTRPKIIEQAFDFAYEGGSNVVDVYVRYLRAKLDRDDEPSIFETVRGVGYRMKGDDPAARAAVS